MDIDWSVAAELSTAAGTLILAFATFASYGDGEGGQRVISRFVCTPHEEDWIVAVARHWHLDRADPR